MNKDCSCNELKRLGYKEKEIIHTSKCLVYKLHQRSVNPKKEKKKNVK